MQNGFTLIELAIVVVVLGILVSGVVAGRSLIESANVNSAVSKVSQYKTALNAFKLEFDAIPGDFEEAEDYGLHQINGETYGVLTFHDDSSTRRNGNDDGYLSGHIQTDNRRYDGEMQNYWVHLKSSGILPDILENISSKTNSYGSAPDYPINSGIHFPKFPIGKSIVVLSDSKTRKLFYLIGTMGEYNDFHLFRAPRNSLPPSVAKKFDKKLDDGDPLRGKIKALHYRNYYESSSVPGVGEITFSSEDGVNRCVHNSEYNLDFDECSIAIEIGK
jgi:prepilin-type N-terminal cleavage/methylation domain-containing protein